MSSFYGKGLFKGLGVTFKHWFKREFTEQYPEQRPNLPPASQGFFDYKVEKCISCGLCVRACPNQVIALESEKDENNKKVVKSYTMDLSYCLYCGLCIEACPTAALTNAQNFEMACYQRRQTFYNMLDPKVAAANHHFDEVQKAYLDKKHPEGPKAGRPEPFKEKPKPKPAPKPAEGAEAAKPAEAPQTAEPKPEGKEGEA